jgi:hypothetical protein
MRSGAGLHSSSAAGQGEQIGPGTQFGSRHERPSHHIAQQRRCLPAQRRAHGIPRELLWFLTMVKLWGADVCRLSCQHCCRTSTSNTFRERQTSSSGSHAKNWIMKGEKEGEGEHIQAKLWLMCVWHVDNYAPLREKRLVSLAAPGASLGQQLTPMHRSQGG